MNNLFDIPEHLKLKVSGAVVAQDVFDALNKACIKLESKELNLFIYGTTYNFKVIIDNLLLPGEYYFIDSKENKVHVNE